MLDFDYLPQLLVDGLIRGTMYGLMAMGMALIFRVMRLINFAHGEYFMLGSYVMYYTVGVLGLPALIGVTVAGVALFFIGAGIERALVAPLRNRLGDAWLTDGFVMTIGLLITLQSAALILFGAREHAIAELVPGRFHVGPVVMTYDRLLILVVGCLIIAGIGAFLKHTDAGRAIRATSADPDAACALGIDIRKYYTMTYGVAAAIVGATGALLITIFPALPTVGSNILIISFFVCVLGGLGNIWGALAAGILLGCVEAFAAVMATGGWHNPIIATVALAVLVFRPAGLFTRSVSRP